MIGLLVCSILALICVSGTHPTYSTVTYCVFPLVGKGVGVKGDTCTPSPAPELGIRGQHLNLQVPPRSHSSASSSEENSSSSAALPLLAGERDSPSPSTEERMFPMNGKSTAE